MHEPRTIAAAVILALLAGVAHGQSDLAPDEAARPAERPAAPANVPTPPDTGQAPAQAPVPEDAPEAPAASPVPEEPSEAPAAAPVPPEGAGTAGGAPMQAPVPAEPDTPATAPAPGPEPEVDGQAPAQPAAPEETDGAPAAAPVPPEEPDIGAEAPAEAPAPAEPPVPEQLAEDDAELAACLGRLRAFGAVFERAEAVTGEDGACGIANPLRVEEIVPGVALEPPDVMRCTTAAALAEWVATFLLPASRLLPEHGALAALRQGSTYVCRPVGGGEELSEHAFGNAVDMMGFRFAEGPPIPVEPREREGTPAEAFQRTARASACLIFTTVLGPGAPDHDDHLHLDIEARESGYRLCQ